MNFLKFSKEISLNLTIFTKFLSYFELKNSFYLIQSMIV